MTYGEFGQLMTGMAALGAFLNSLRNSRKIEEVRLNTNGKMEELVTEVRAASFAAGQKDEKEKGNGP